MLSNNWTGCCTRKAHLSHPSKSNWTSHYIGEARFYRLTRAVPKHQQALINPIKSVLKGAAKEYRQAFLATLKMERCGKAFCDKLIKDDVKTYREGQQEVIEAFLNLAHGNSLDKKTIVKKIREMAYESLTELEYDMKLKRGI